MLIPCIEGGDAVKNVLFVLPFLGYTGADRVIFTLLNNLDRTKIKPFLLVHSDKEEKKWSD